MLEAEEAARDSAVTDTNFYEVTIASVDQPKLLSRLSEALVSQCSSSSPEAGVHCVTSRALLLSNISLYRET